MTFEAVALAVLGSLSLMIFGVAIREAVAIVRSRRDPEDFDVVPDSEIAAWREKLNARFDLGRGRLKTLEDGE